MSGFAVAPVELDGAAATLRAMGARSPATGGGELGAGGLSGALEGLGSRVRAATGALEGAGTAVATGLAGGAVGYASTDAAAMPAGR